MTDDAETTSRVTDIADLMWNLGRALSAHQSDSVSLILDNGDMVTATITRKVKP
jgi:hypothetical protein